MSISYLSNELYLLVVIWPLQFGPIGVVLAQLFQLFRYPAGTSQSTVSIIPAWNACISPSTEVYSWILIAPEPGVTVAVCMVPVWTPDEPNVAVYSLPSGWVAPS